MEDEKLLKLQIQRFQKKIYGFVLCLIGRDRNKAYDIAVASFVDALRATANLNQDDVLLANLAAAAIKRSADVEVMPTFDESEFKDLEPGKKRSLTLVGRALHLLTFETKSLLLLRSQLHMPYKDIGTLFQMSESDARSTLAQANVRFREKIEDVLNGTA